MFARHGYVFLFLFRQGIGLSGGQGTADGDLMSRALATEGVRGRNRVQLQLLDGEELNEALAGLAFLRTLSTVDPKRVAVLGHSFGGSLTLVLAARDTTIRAAVVFGPAAASWEQSPDLRARLVGSVDKAHTPLMFIHAANDYSVAPGEVLAAEMERSHRAHVLKIYNGIGTTAREGHNLVYLDVPAWERDVFRFLDAYLTTKP
ncbi:MAG TPA: dienelactone hydrolase family protein [Gemmatimonadaceae bacterium]